MRGMRDLRPGQVSPLQELRSDRRTLLTVSSTSSESPGTKYTGAACSTLSPNHTVGSQSPSSAVKVVVRVLWIAPLTQLKSNV